MKMYLVAFAVGLLVGIIYGILNVRSPAPPIVALVGLFGILLGEQLVPLGKRLISGETVNLAVVYDHARDHVFGVLPTRRHLRHPVATDSSAKQDT